MSAIRKTRPPKSLRQIYKRGPKPKRSTPRSPHSRIEAQRGMAVLDMLAELPRHCSLGVKKSSKADQQYWRRYKLHLDVADGQIPITALLTGLRTRFASSHPIQVAIPLMTLSSERVTYLYELMDKAYDAHAIQAHSEALGHRALTELPQRHRRVSEKVHQRSMVERVYSRLKDEFGVRSIRFRGASKIMAH